MGIYYINPPKANVNHCSTWQFQCLGIRFELVSGKFCNYFRREFQPTLNTLIPILLSIVLVSKSSFKISLKQLMENNHFFCWRHNFFLKKTILEREENSCVIFSWKTIISLCHFINIKKLIIIIFFSPYNPKLRFYLFLLINYFCFSFIAINSDFIFFYLWTILTYHM